MTTYNQLKNIIPADQALASKALQVGLEQVKNIFDATLPVLANATVALETTKGLGGIQDLSAPLPANVIAFYQTQFYNGSGPEGTLLLTDVIGTPTGCVMNPSLTSVTSTLNNMTVNGELVTLIGSQQVYATMETALSGVWTVETSPGDPLADPPVPPVYTTTIPAGWVAPGAYTGSSSGDSISAAFSTGLNPAMISVVGTIASTYSSQVNSTTANFANICIQIQTENLNLALADVQFANLVANLTPWNLVYSLQSNGLDTTEGGSAYVLQSVANLSTQGGQAMIGTMREARNLVRLSNAGLGTDIILSNTGPEPQAVLTRGEYSASEAASQKTV
jgi:hypothetical protein